MKLALSRKVHDSGRDLASAGRSDVGEAESSMLGVGGHGHVCDGVDAGGRRGVALELAAS